MASPPQLPLADDLFLTAHDTVRGKCLLSPATLGLGLSASLLAELVLWRRLDILDSKIVIIDDRPTGDPATTAVLDQLLREGGTTASSGTGSRSWPPASPSTWSSAGSPGPGT